MSSSELDHLWLRYLRDPDAIDEETKDRLVDLLENDPSARTQLRDDRSIDAMLSLLASSDSHHAHFVSSCIERYTESIQNDQANEISDDYEAGFVRVHVSPRRHLDKPVKALGARSRTQKMVLVASIAIGVLLPLAVLVWLLDSVSPGQPDGTRSAESNQRVESNGTLDDALSDFERKSNSVVSQEAAEAKPKDVVSEQPPPKQNENAPRFVETTPDQTDHQSKSQKVPAGIARLTSSPDAQWQQLIGETVGAGQYTLQRGRARLEFDDGSTIQVTGPSDFEIKSDREVFLQQGAILATIAPESKDFLVESPVAQISQPPAAQFQLNVDDTGQSEVYVDRGRVGLNRRQADHIHRWELDAAGLNQALVGTDVGSQSPAICMARGTDLFRGLVEIDGKSVELGSPEVFSAVLDQIASSRERSPRSFSREWEKFVERFAKDGSFSGSIGSDNGQRAFNSFEEMFEVFRTEQKKIRDALQGGSTNFQGQFNFNGRQQRIDSIEELNRIQSDLFGPLFDLGNITSGNTNSAFQGVININGREMRFTSPEEFKRARGRLNR